MYSGIYSRWYHTNYAGQRLYPPARRRHRWRPTATESTIAPVESFAPMTPATLVHVTNCSRTESQPTAVLVTWRANPKRLQYCAEYQPFLCCTTWKNIDNKKQYFVRFVAVVRTCTRRRRRRRWWRWRYPDPCWCLWALCLFADDAAGVRLRYCLRLTHFPPKSRIRPFCPFFLFWKLKKRRPSTLKSTTALIWRRPFRAYNSKTMGLCSRDLPICQHRSVRCPLGIPPHAINQCATMLPSKVNSSATEYERTPYYLYNRVCSFFRSLILLSTFHNSGIACGWPSIRPPYPGVNYGHM